MKTLIKFTSEVNILVSYGFKHFGNASFVSIPLIKFTHFADIEGLP